VLLFTTGGGNAVYTYGPAVEGYADLQDAGVGVACNPRIIVCHERVNPRLRNRLADAGYPTNRKYARVARQAQLCSNPDGGVSELIVPGFEYLSNANDEAQLPSPSRCSISACAAITGFCGTGPKSVALAPGASGWVRAPLDGGQACKRSEYDGGFRWFGRGNVFPSSESNGSARCEEVTGGTIIYGDDPLADL